MAKVWLIYNYVYTYSQVFAVEIVGCTDSIDEVTTDHKYVNRKEGACGDKRRKSSILVISLLALSLSSIGAHC